MNSIQPLVSVFCPTYNHENFIRQCLDGIVMQKTTFQIEVFVQDDASTDKTPEIVKGYAEKYNFIIPVLHTENHYSKGKNLNEYFFKNARGKYIALCEGDDYWTDPYKLQKQVDFLEANKDFAICFHNSNVYNEEEQKKIFEQPGIEKNMMFTIENFLESNPIATASVLFRSKYVEQIPEWFNQSPFGDYALYLIILKRSQQKAMYFKDAMSVYRIHSNGIHGKAHLSNVGLVNAYKQHLHFWEVIKKYLLINQYRKEINKTLSNNYSTIINYLLLDKKYKEALKYNTVFLIKLNFTFFKLNIKIYNNILREVILL
jgi:glycosyltransferase involved in cell wall biosynthesis